MKTYKIVEVDAQTAIWHEVYERLFWFFWLPVNDIDGSPRKFASLDGAEKFVIKYRQHRNHKEVKRIKI